VAINATFPPGWTATSGNGTYFVPAHQETPLYVKAKIAGSDVQTLLINAEAPGANLPPITIVVHPDRAALPQ
jgi:hypothetical protein